MSYRWYVALIVVGGAIATLASHLLWPADWSSRQVAVTALTAVLVAGALAFPIKASPQATASLAMAPIFLGVLLLSPLQAVAAGVAGSLATDVWLRRRPLVMGFNLGVTSLAVALASMVYHTLPAAEASSLLSPTALVFGALAGAVLIAANLAAMAGMVSLRKGLSFWGLWRKTWVMDSLQEGGALVLGYLGALLVQEAWWALLLEVVPLVLAYLALDRSVHESRANVELAQQLKVQMEELRATQAQLIQSAKMASLGAMAAGVAHEINNPLFAIQGRAELLLRHAERHLATERAREYLRGIQDMAQRASTIVQELLTFSRPNNVSEPVKLPAVIDAALDLVGREITAHDIEIRKEYAEVPPLRGIPNRLQQVFVNVLLNARDAMPQGGTLLVRCWAQDGRVKASVRDTGTGIARDLQARVFEPFFTTKEVGKGTGLGLYVCHRIVTEHDGRISIESEEGKGTEVEVEFPAEIPAPVVVNGSGR